MNREEKISLLEEQVEFYKHKDETEGLFPLTQLDYEKTKLLLKLLQIKPRTIDELEVGDVFIFENENYYISTMHELQSIKKQLSVNKEIEIIPHEFIALWSEWK